jgi:hypothetical protein
MWSFISIAAGISGAVLYTLYEHKNHISEYEDTALDDINDNKNHIIKLENAGINILDFQNTKSEQVNYSEIEYRPKMHYVPVTKSKTVWVLGLYGMVPRSEFYTENELQLTHNNNYAEKTKFEPTIQRKLFFIQDHDNIVFDDAVEINNAATIKIKDIDGAKNYISTNIPNFEQGIEFNYCFQHHQFTGTVYLYGKMIGEKFMCGHISDNKAHIIEKQSKCHICLNKGIWK